MLGPRGNNLNWGSQKEEPRRPGPASCDRDYRAVAETGASTKRIPHDSATKRAGHQGDPRHGVSYDRSRLSCQPADCWQSGPVQLSIETMVIFSSPDSDCLMSFNTAGRILAASLPKTPPSVES